MEAIFNIPKDIYVDPKFKEWFLNNFPEVEWIRKTQGDRVTLKSEIEIDENEVDNIALNIAELLRLFPTTEIKGSFRAENNEIEINFGSDEDGIQTIEYFYTKGGEEMNGIIETEVDNNGIVIKRDVSINVEDE
jgi:hypothetical protein